MVCQVSVAKGSVTSDFSVEGDSEVPRTVGGQAPHRTIPQRRQAQRQKTRDSVHGGTIVGKVFRGLASLGGSFLRQAAEKSVVLSHD